jgi:retinal rod rhodopsin-sensitive cGMP 3',5'-cyclic phosphodiesterase subunit delta
MSENDECHLKHTSKLSKIKQGFKINWMKMKDGKTGTVMWECSEWDLTKEDSSENLPKELLDCKLVVREVNFSSIETIDNLELIQNFYLVGELIESTRFNFGFVIPKSTNSWEQILEAKDEMMPYHILSGNLNVETIFLSNGHIISKNNILIYYV